MSGETWDYRDRCVRDLADDIRGGHARWHDDDSETLDLDAARGFMADLLTVAADLLHELDWHFAGDSLIPNEGDWLASARGRLHDIVSTEWGVVQRRRPGLHRGPMSKADAEEWVREWVEEGVDADLFMVASRTVTPWRQS